LASNPTTDLAQIPALRKLVDSRFARHLRGALHRGSADPPIDDPIRSSVQPESPAVINRLQVLKKWRANLGKQLSIDPALLWPKASLERLAKSPGTLGAELVSPEIRQWQREQFAKLLCSSLSVIE